jgi:secondary thiamine-phosphate synthase enzyme
MQQAFHRLAISTRGKGLYDVTRDIRRWVAEQAIKRGLLTVWCRHTSCSLLVQENADPDVRADLEAFFQRIAPEREGLYRHDVEGMDDMPAHIRAALTTTSLGVPVERGDLVLGTWQAVYLYEHRAAGHRRELVLHLIGDA